MEDYCDKTHSYCVIGHNLNGLMCPKTNKMSQIRGRMKSAIQQSYSVSVCHSNKVLQVEATKFILEDKESVTKTH